MEHQITQLLRIIDESNQSPSAIHEDGATTYVIYRMKYVGATGGYVVTKIVESGVATTVISNGFLAEDAAFDIKIMNAALLAALAAVEFD
jgi:hypothetical protein